MKRFIIPIFISHKGCRHRCIFCNQNVIAQQPVLPENIFEIVNSYINTQIKKFGKIHPKYKKKQISFYGGSFTCINNELMIEYLEKAHIFIKNKSMDSLRLSTRPDCINPEILNVLKKYSVETIELGAQTLDDNLLKFLNRGHTLEDIINAAYLIKEKNFELGIQLMVGVPKETNEIIDRNIDILINKIKPDFIRIYPLLVLKGTKLEYLYKSGKFTPLSFENIVKRCKKILEKCIKKDIEIIRIGLQTTESLKNSVVAGKFYENIGQIIKESINMEEAV